MFDVGYVSPFSYRCDPLVLNPNGPRGFNPIHYSSQRKSFYGPVPSNSQSPYAPVNGFNISRLPQTAVTDLAISRMPAPNGLISLDDTIRPLRSRIGAITQSDGTFLGTCTLISANLVLTARHVVVGKKVQNLKVVFGSVQEGRNLPLPHMTQLDYVVEHNAIYDYAIIKLAQPLGNQLGYVQMNPEESLLSEAALLHYPLGKPLQVSVHSFDQHPYGSIFLNAFHDSDYSSSGGGYIDYTGRLTAIHLGSQPGGDQYNLFRRAVTVNEIVRNKPHCLLARLANNQLPLSKTYISNNPNYLPLSPSIPVFDEEGRKSKEILTGLLPDDNKRIRRTKTGVALSEKNLSYIKRHYPGKFQEFINKCLYQIGLHKDTKQYSVTVNIESDHVLPYDVFRSTTNASMHDLITGGGSRPGENELPAITVPYNIHRKLRTTVSKKFRQRLVTLCNQNKVDEALFKCFKEYRKNGINLKWEQVSEVLLLYKKLKVITGSQKTSVLISLFPQHLDK